MTMTKNEEILYGEIYKILNKYLTSTIDNKLKNHIATETVAVMVPVLDDMEKKLAKKIKQEPKKPDPAEKEKPSESKGIEYTIRAIKTLWEINKKSTLSSHLVETGYKESITKHAASHSDEWSKAMAWLENKDEVLKSNMTEFKLGFSKWVATNFCRPEIMVVLLDLLTENKK